MAASESANCPSCGTAIPAGAELCPRCGAAIAGQVSPGEAPAGRQRSRKPTWLVLAGVALVGLAVAAVLLFAGGDGPAPADKPGDGPVSRARLLEAADLPGGPWQVTTDATLAKAGGISGFPSSAVPPSEECALVHNFEGELARLDASFSSGASRVVQREGGRGQSPATVTHTLLVFSDSVDLGPVLGGVAAALNGPGFGPCLEQGAGAAGLEATVSPVSALVPPPNGGAAAGLRLAKRAAPGEAPLILQLFYWRTGQTLTVVSIVGPESVVTRDLVTEAVAAAQRAFERRSP